MRGTGGGRRRRGGDKRDKRFLFFHIFFTFYKRDIRLLLFFVLCYKRDQRFLLFYIFFPFCTMFSFQEEEIRKEEERRESTEREEAEFVKSVRETGGGVIGLVNKTNRPLTFTSLRLLIERSQVKENR